MRRGFMYLYAIIDVYSRYIVAWGLCNTLEADNAIEVLNRAIETHGAPEIINSAKEASTLARDGLRNATIMAYQSVWMVALDALTTFG